jgi:hypothetical protein
MIVRVQLIGSGGRPPSRTHVAFVAIPRTPEAPSVVLWSGRAFHRFGGAGGRKLRDGDIYRECSAVTGITIEEREAS